jgi:hypothetical protein
MRSHSATRFFTLLMVALLVCAVAAPAEGKRPRRYDATVLMDWTICPTSATLTIGFQGDSQALPDPNPDEGTWPLVDVDAELPGSPGSSLIEGGPRLGLKVTDVRNKADVLVNQIDDDAGKVVTDDPPLDADGNPIEGSPTTITHEEVVDVRWSQPLAIRAQLRLGLAASGVGLTYGLFETVFCPSTETGPGDSTPGVTTPGPSLSTEEIREVSDRIDESRLVGRGRDGSLVPRAKCTIVGTPADDRISGTPGNDVICGLGGSDVIDGAGGIDVIDGANGNDRVTGASGNDPLLLGLRGNDRLNGNRGDDAAFGGAGTDRVRGSSGKDRLSGGAGDDMMNGGRGGDGIGGGSGDDDIRARDGTRDRVNGGSGLDHATVDVAGSAVGAQRRADRVRGVEQLP